MHEKGSRYIDFLLPGILGPEPHGHGIWGIGFSIVNARLKKTLKLMVATPMRKRDYLLAQMLSRFVFLVLEVGADPGLRRRSPSTSRSAGSSGSLAALDASSAPCRFAGLGLLVVSRARTLEAASGLMNLVMVPMWLLSGVFFSSERFPKAAQPVIQALPLTALNNVSAARDARGQDA